MRQGRAEQPLSARGSRGQRTLRIRAVLLIAAALLCVAPAASASAAALTPERFAKLDAVYTAAVALDSRRIPVSALTTIERACAGLRVADAFERPLRAECLTGVAIVRTSAALDACRTPRTCLRASKAMRTALTAQIAASRLGNYAVDAVVPKGPCRSVLHVSARQLRGLERFRSALKLLERADTEADLRRALKRIESIDTGEDEDSTAAKERRAFRRACG